MVIFSCLKNSPLSFAIFIHGILVFSIARNFVRKAVLLFENKVCVCVFYKLYHDFEFEVYIYSFYVLGAPICLQCIGVSQPTMCTNVVQCGASEVL